MCIHVTFSLHYTCDLGLILKDPSLSHCKSSEKTSTSCTTATPTQSDVPVVIADNDSEEKGTDIENPTNTSSSTVPLYALPEKFKQKVRKN